MGLSICVFSSSSSAVKTDYVEAARQLGALIAENSHTLVFGGTDVGLMGTLAHAVKDGGGRVISVIPRHISEAGLGMERADETVITDDLSSRKAIMESRSDAFIALPGGFGTLDEIAEVLTLKQLRLHAKPIAFINTKGFYNPLADFFNQLVEQRFAKPDHAELCLIASDPMQALEYIEHYLPRRPSRKWWDR